MIDEEDKSQGQDSYERRHIEKLNRAERQKRKKVEMTRLRSLVDGAYALDPRIKRQKKEEQQRKDEEKLRRKQETERKKQAQKQKEAEEMAKILLETKQKSMEDVWRCCAYLYSLESFLYKTLNVAMRLVGSKDDEKTWRSKIKTLGPFCLLLWDDPFNKKARSDIELYRGANLTPEQINTYKEMAESKDEYGSFQSFSSCSRNPLEADKIGNALFIMKVLYAFVADLSELSEYPNEEEELVTPGVCFRVERVEFEKNKKKHYICLELKQRFNGKKYKLIIAFLARLTFPL